MLKNDFSKGEEAVIEKISRKIIPDEQEKCTAFRIFNKDGNVDKFFNGINKLEILVKDLEEHKESHVNIKLEIESIKKKRFINRVYAFVGAGLGAFAAMWLERRIK